MIQKEKKKLKRKWLIFILFIVIGLTGGIGYLFWKQSINHYYHPYVISRKKANLYNSKKQIVGTITASYPLELNKKESLTQYFKIKNTPYYIYYQDVKKSKKISKDTTLDYQLSLNKTITSTKKTILYKENKEQLTLTKGFSLPVIYEDQENYYISFQEKILSIKKNNSIQEKAKNVEDNNTISVLFFENITDTCQDQNCTTVNAFKAHIAKLLEDGYYTITDKDLANYLDGYIRLKPKAILLITSTPLESLKPIMDEYKITIHENTEEILKYYSTNTTNSKKNNKQAVNRYQIKTTDSTEKILKMAHGEPTEIEINSQGVAVINYHFFYNRSGNEVCNEAICLDTAKFKEHLEYLKSNHFQTLTMNEFKRWMYGEIDLPTKSVLLTVDDGAMGTGKHNGNKLNPLLEEYKLHATLFLIAGWWDIENYRSPYLDIQSHTYDMHQYGSCGRGQINCATYEQAKADLEKSLSIIGNNDSFCFPFYYYSDTSLKAVQDAGFKLAFVGGNRKATRNNNKFLIPRYPIQSDITLERFINIVN